MKILITNNESDIAIDKDFSDLTTKDRGLIGQTIAELELIKEELLFIYGDKE